jgi:hypothetical protein
MPEDILLKKACIYGSEQILAIMKESNNIKFKFKEPSDQSESGSSFPADELRQSTPPSVLNQLAPAAQDLGPAHNEQLTELDAKMVLSEIVGEEAAIRVLNGGELIQESEVEVVSLSLSQELYLKLHLCQHYFTEYALTSVASNLAHSLVAGGIILAIYTTDEKEKFWLFYTQDYTPSHSVTLKNQNSRSRIWGHWFDLNPSTGANTLEQAKSYITAKSIIHSRVGCVYLTHGQEV